MTPAWPWALALTIALGALIVAQVQLHERAAKSTDCGRCCPT